MRPRSSIARHVCFLHFLSIARHVRFLHFLRASCFQLFFFHKTVARNLIILSSVLSVVELLPAFFSTPTANMSGRGKGKSGTKARSRLGAKQTAGKAFKAFVSSPRFARVH